MDLTTYYTILKAFCTAFALAFLLTPPVKVLAGYIGAVDVPRDDRRMHTSPTPRLGGLAIFLGFLISALLFCDSTRQLRGILMGAILIVVLGVLDDVLALPAKPKFLVQTIAALIPVLSGVRVEVLTNFNLFSDRLYINLGALSIPLTLIWIVGMTNAVNFIDGLDGLAIGVSSIATLSILAIAVLVSNGPEAVVAAALCGACFGFFPFNLNPAKIFMGDTGATFLGYLLATLSVQGLFKMYAVISFVVPFLIFGLPIFDTAFAMLRRVAEGRSPMAADRGHLHHRLIDMGFTQKQTVAIMYVVSAILGLAAVLLATSSAVKAILLILCAMAGAMVAARMVDDRRAALLRGHEREDGDEQNR
ncbi:MAG: undecaprenyl/decaprenyl-phosphate alpha-N-acetylglucosaminyl 1-phosphate transferase [Clostridiales bacterium]|nr:undecaprenyl/decaprenyl-phosphate alpha-N-acetylglucosaminyl 1-phosphate transferase [Clostridiales bacterium]